MRLERVAPGQATISMPIAPTMVNGHGICHGGYIFTLADSAFAFACNTHGERVVAAGASISFLRPAKLGMRLNATAVERVRTGRSGIYDIRVEDEAGMVIAEFRGQSRSLGTRFFEEAP
ncbi:MAG: hydroxyphenylacetyl-CoA thioesterase PaaI [Rhodospirillales bacterium]|nr:hydroxyphenylacetyl-CoA thioesterase PaaI [Rhodospirillales bacterium]